MLFSDHLLYLDPSTFSKSVKYVGLGISAMEKNKAGKSGDEEGSKLQFKIGWPEKASFR